MKAPSRRQWGVRAAGGLTALLLVLLLSPAAARASCGDYVRRGGPAALPGPDHAAPPAAPGPCRGPSCSGTPAPLLPPLAAPAPAPVEQWACLAFAAADPQGGPFQSLADGPAPPPSRHGPSVYHPPRPTAPDAGR